MAKRRATFAVLAMTFFAVALACGQPEQDCSEKDILHNDTVSEQLACIYVLAKGSEGFSPEVVNTQSVTYRAALNSLVASGYLVRVGTFDPAPGGLPTFERPVERYYPTAEGMDYLYSHKHPVRYWLQKNWFPFSVAIMNVFIGLITVGVIWRTSTNGRSNRNDLG